MIFDFVGHISKICKILPLKCYTEYKTQMIKLNIYIINTNHDTVIIPILTKLGFHSKTMQHIN